MTFSERDNFIVASVIMITSDTLKKLPRSVRTTVLSFIREKKYPSITDEDWAEIANGINEHKKEILTLLLKAFRESHSDPQVSADKAFLELDTEIKETLPTIDFDELKRQVDASNDPKLRDYYLTMRQLKRDFDAER